MGSTVLSVTESRAFTEYFAPASGDSVGFAAKANMEVAGHATSLGSESVGENAPIATRDAECVSRLKEAGLVLVGITKCGSFAYGAKGETDFGAQNAPVNAIDSRLVPGGSSSGSAVAVARGFVRIGLGTDTAGSNRVPAHANGVIGFKPEYGRIPTDGVHPLAPSLDTIGPIARTVEDIFLAMRSLDTNFAQADSTVSPRVARLVLKPVRQEQAEHDETVGEALSEASLTSIAVVEGPIVEGWDEAFDATSKLTTAGLAASNRQYRNQADRFSPLVQDKLKEGDKLLADAELMRDLHKFQEDWRRLFQSVMESEGFDAIVLPTSDGPIPSWDEVTRARITRNVNPINPTGLAAVTVPWRHSQNPKHPGQIFSVQAVGRQDMVLEAAKRLEASRPDGNIPVPA